MHITIDGDTCVLSPCVNANGDPIIFDGVIFSSTDNQEAAAYGDDMFRQFYNDSQYTIEPGSLMTVTPPVSVPIWVGDYRPA